MFEILNQDNDLVAMNKPSGWLVHCLDRPTSGVLLFAFSSEIARLLSVQFATKQIEKTYHAIVRGYVDG